LCLLAQFTLGENKFFAVAAALVAVEKAG